MTRTEEEAIAQFHANCVRNEVTGCVEWTKGLFTSGYGALRWKGKIVKAHRLAYELSHGAIEACMCILHACDNPKCCSPDHLRQGTQKENTQDMLSRNRQAAKLTELQVAEIRTKYASISDLTYAVLGAQYGVSNVTICKIVRYKIWKHLAASEN